MGGSNEKTELINKINADEWVKVGEIRNADIVKNKKTGQEGQIRVIPFDNKRNLNKELEIYNYRKIQDNALVRCLGAESLDAKSTGCCGKESNMRVLTQRIVKRWVEMPQLTFPETIYALYESLRGYQDISQKSGVFEVTEQMIGINSQGKVKVWCHENWAYNHPRDEKAVLKSTTVDPEGRQITNEKEMVENIIDVIEQRCEEGRFPADFRQRIHKNSKTFISAENEVESYARQKNIYVPDLIHPNTEVLVKKIIQMVPKKEVQPIKLESGVPQIRPVSQAPYKIQPIKIQTVTQERPTTLNYTERQTTLRNSKVLFTYRNSSVKPTEIK